MFRGFAAFFGGLEDWIIRSHYIGRPWCAAGGATASGSENEKLSESALSSVMPDHGTPISFPRVVPTGGCHNRFAGRFASQEVYIAMHLNGDIASGRPGATSYRADFRLERINLPCLLVGTLRAGRSVAERPANKTNKSEKQNSQNKVEMHCTLVPLNCPATVFI